MIRTLYSKLALALAALVAALLIAQLFVTMRVSQVYEEEATQRLYEDLAGRMRSGSVRTADAGHLAPMEEPRRVADEVLAFSARPGAAPLPSPSSRRAATPRG